jgi:hypothetical protein
MKTRTYFLFHAVLFAALPVVAPAAFGQLTSAELTDVGFTSLQARLGAATPTGAGISVSQVEAPEGTTGTEPYRPTAISGHNFIYADPAGNATPSGHATTVGSFFYGPGSLAPGIGTGAAHITSYDANSWIGSEFLHTNGSLPATETNLIENHSWIGTTGVTATDVQIVRRLDYAIQQQHFLAVIGLNNGSGTTVPSLLAGAYNGITVGVSSGEHSRGGTTIEGTRTRPDIVVPTSATSWATASVSSAGALIMENASASGRRSEVVKAVLMAGATRSGESEFSWSHTTTQPLDAVYGAGELNVDRSQQIIAAGEQNSSATVDVSNIGWDLGTKVSASNNLYFFEITASSDVSAVLTWDRVITATFNGSAYVFGASLADLNLRFFQATGNVLGTEIAASLSTTENSELIQLNNLAAGRYAIEVSSLTATTTDYGLAWYSVVPEPASALLVAAQFAFLARRRRR